MWQVVDIHVDEAKRRDLVKRRRLFRNVAIMDALETKYIPLSSFENDIFYF
jgi:hypothetical protein